MPKGFGADILKEFVATSSPSIYIEITYSDATGSREFPLKVFTVSVPDGGKVILHEGTAIRQSSFLRAILSNQSNFKESVDRNVHLVDFESGTLNDLASFLAYGRLGFAMNNQDNFLPAFKLYHMADYLGMPWLKKRIIDGYFWGFRQNHTVPTLESTNWLLAHVPSRQGLCALVLCHWRDTTGLERSRTLPIFADETIKKEIFELKWARAGTPTLQIRSPLSKIKPHIFYDVDINNAVQAQEQAKDEEEQTQKASWKWSRRMKEYKKKQKRQELKEKIKEKKKHRKLNF